MAIQHITELFALDDEGFITEAYRNFYHREPDEHGLAYFKGRLALGFSRANIIFQLSKSNEMCPLQDIPGLTSMIRDERRANHWFFRWFARGQSARLQQSGIFTLANLERRLASLQYCLYSTAQRQEQLLQQQTDALIEQNNTLAGILLVQQSSGSVDASESVRFLKNEIPTIGREVVVQLFHLVLGRDPESEQVILHHAAHSSPHNLLDSLINSGEFQLRLQVLSEQAQIIFKQQIHSRLKEI